MSTRALALLALVMAAPVVLAAPAKRALLVGVASYHVADLDLEGPVNDVQALRAVLIKRWGFRSGEVTTLTDRQATRANILRALQRLRDASQPGDLALFYFSGHGTSVRERRRVKPCQVMFCRPRGSLKLNAIITAMGRNRYATVSAV